MILLIAGSGCDIIYGLDKITFEDGGSGGSGGNGGAGGTTTTTIPATCVPSNTGTVDDSCGVFVSSSKGSDDNDGTKDKPFATIAKAMGAAKGRPVYLCGETFPEAIEIAAGGPIYGALDCSADWTYTPSKRSAVAPGANMIPLRVKAKTSAELNDVDLVAADATVPGGSSIAMIAEAETDVMLSRSNVTAGRGADGASGAAFDMPAMSGGDGLDGKDACTGNFIEPGLSVKNTCGAEESISGSGGIGQESSGGSGSPGAPGATMNGGLGEVATACTDGTVGDPGAAGTAGPGASGMGSLLKEGFTGVAGGDGQPGKVGQGGGGGGGAKGGTTGNTCNKVMNAPGNAGASGASGGAGGCGGSGGKGGAAGGASIGIMSLGAALHFEDVTITATAGGTGGSGGDGQVGGAGGMGGAGGKVPAGATDLKPGCKGGPGGIGGAGGRGGGGLGGHSIGIAHTGGSAPDMTGAKITIGAPGQGGAGDGPSGNGAAGVAKEVQGF